MLKMKMLSTLHMHVTAGRELVACRKILWMAMVPEERRNSQRYKPTYYVLAYF